MSKTRVIAIFDVGKTNKKLFLFDEQYNVLFERSESFPETADEDGDPCEDLQLLTGWIKKMLLEISQMTDVAVKALNFSAYGASFVHLDQDGVPVTPLYNYLKPYPEQLKNKFYKKYGGELGFSLQTASPVLGNLNSGLQLYWLKHQQTALFEKIHSSLHLPQYLSFLVSGKRYSDITSIGCHTAMWDFSRNHYHEWLHREGILDKLAPAFPPDQTIPTNHHREPLLCGVGLHDSSAALIPYLSNFAEPFALISTGTWCITLNPFNQTSLTAEELEQDCLCYIQYRGTPVKASRLFAGYEHELQIKRLAEHFHCSLDYYKQVHFNPLMINGPDCIINRSNDTGNKKLLSASGFENKDLSLFETYEAAYHQLLTDIMRQQVNSTNLALNNSNVKKIFVDGGFSNNPVYLNLLATAFSDAEVYAASMSQASALGSALAIHHSWNEQPIRSDLIQLKRFGPQHCFS